MLSCLISNFVGGGHSDIFGGVEEDKSRPKMKQQGSQITDCFKMDQVDNTIKKKIEVVVDTKTEEETENNEPAPIEENEKPAPTVQPQRVRVPPGGFSSGFW